MYCFNYKDELYHHGVKGMRWGVRRYQSYDTVPRESGKRGKEILDAKAAKKYRKSYQKILNKNAKNLAADRHDAEVVSREKKAIDAKIQKKKSKGKKVSERLQNKSKQYDKRLRETNKRIAEHEKETKQVVSKLLKKGIDVKIKDARYSVPASTGKEAIKNSVISGLMTAASFGVSVTTGMPAFVVLTGSANKGERYKLSDNNDGKGELTDKRRVSNSKNRNN